MNYLNALLLKRQIEKFKKTKNGLEFADRINQNITPEYLDPPRYDEDQND